MVSVIVTTKNEERHIGTCLRSVRRQTLPQNQIEIIVVDNGSADKTKEIARSFTAHVFDEGPERSAQRNAGIARAVGTYILFVDADMTLSEDVLSQCVKACQGNNWVACYIPEIVVGNGFWTRARNFERGFYTGSCIDAVRFFRKDVCLAIGGFDESLNGPEDWDFDRRMNARGACGVIEAPLYHDEGDFSFRRYLGKKRYYAQSMGRYAAKWGRQDALVHKQLGFLYRYVGVFTEKGKARLLFRHPGLTAGMLCLRTLVGFTYLFAKNKNSATHG